MDIYNNRNDYVQIAIYNRSDEIQKIPLIQARLAPEEACIWNEGPRRSVKVWFHADGRWIGPKICGTNAVSIDQAGNITNSRPYRLVTTFRHL